MVQDSDDFFFARRLNFIGANKIKLSHLGEVNRTRVGETFRTRVGQTFLDPGLDSGPVSGNFPGVHNLVSACARNFLAGCAKSFPGPGQSLDQIRVRV